MKGCVSLAIDTESLVNRNIVKIMAVKLCNNIHEYLKYSDHYLYVFIHVIHLYGDPNITPYDVYYRFLLCHEHTSVPRDTVSTINILQVR